MSMSDDFNHSQSTGGAGSTPKENPSGAADSHGGSSFGSGAGYDPSDARSEGWRAPGSTGGQQETEKGKAEESSGSPAGTAWSGSETGPARQTGWNTGVHAGSSTGTGAGGWQSPSQPRQSVPSESWSFTQDEDERPQDRRPQDGHPQDGGQGASSGGGNGPGDPYVTISSDGPEPNRSAGGVPPKPRKKRGLKIFGTVAGVILLIGLVTFASYGAYYMFSDRHVQNPGSSQSGGQQSGSVSSPDIDLESKPVTESSGTSSDGAMTTNEIYKKVSPTVVGIIQYRASTSDFLAGSAVSGEGSGIVMTEDGYILTNAHVISGAAGIKVVLSNGDQYEARVIGSDVKTDLAVIKIEATGLQYASFGNSDEIEIGELAVAIGNPGGQLFANSISQGCVSGINRQITTEDGYTITCIQTDAAINPGNSGGALVNQYGQVIGINSSKIVAEGYEGLGFAIPTNTAIPIAQDLIANGRVTGRAVLGITVQMVDSTTAQYYSVPTGLLILSTQENSDISQKGVVPGDIITAVNGTALTSTNDLYKILNEKSPGDTLEVTVFRRATGQEDKTFTVTVTLIEENADAS